MHTPLLSSIVGQACLDGRVDERQRADRKITRLCDLDIEPRRQFGDRMADKDRHMIALVLAEIRVDAQQAIDRDFAPCLFPDFALAGLGKTLITLDGAATSVRSVTRARRDTFCEARLSVPNSGADSVALNLPRFHHPRLSVSERA